MVVVVVDVVDQVGDHLVETALGVGTCTSDPGVAVLGGLLALVVPDFVVFGQVELVGANFDSYL